MRRRALATAVGVWASPLAAKAAQDVQALAEQAIHRLDLQTELLRRPEPFGLNLNLPPEVLWLVVIVGAGVLLYAFRDMIPMLRASHGGAWVEDEAGGSDMGARAPEVVLGAADDLAAQGRFVEAMHVLLLQAFAEIRRRLDEQFAEFHDQSRNPAQQPAVGRSSPPIARGRQSRRVDLFRRASRRSRRLSRLPIELQRADPRPAQERGRMTGDSIFSRKLLIGWIVAAVLTFAVSLYLMGRRDQSTDTVGPSTFSRSAIGYAGLAEVLQRLDIPVVKSRYDSLGKLTPGSVLVIAEPLPGGKTEEIMRTLLKADTILLVLPKWTGQPSKKKSGWLGEAVAWPTSDVGWALHLVAPQADVLEVDQAVWTTNALNLTPGLEAPIHLIHGDRLQPLIGDADGMLLGAADRSQPQDLGAVGSRRHRQSRLGPHRQCGAGGGDDHAPASPARAASCSTKPYTALSPSRQIRSCCCSASPS